ncbi:11804_t:CDS:2 [Ambispora gerdemannii]|uniref:11804_t:CDS:1 n=1 Tax=Ambispora gerdemannii TaxID=144530 RepID=A0A9N8VES0_9GLOM|nr:11804_t:CDS:2 [Ambispora gerdemannii]
MSNLGIAIDLPPRPPARLGFYEDMDGEEEDKTQNVPPRPPARLGFYNENPLKERREKEEDWVKCSSDVTINNIKETTIWGETQQ